MTSQDSPWTKHAAIWLPFLLSAVLAGGILLGMRLEEASPAIVKYPRGMGAFHQSATQGRMDEIIRFIDAKYVDEVSSKPLVRKAIEAILHELDPHSTYIPAEELAAINESLEGNFDGIGIEFMMLDDTIVVVTPLAGGPSEAAGVLAGDKIITISDTLVAGQEISNQDIYKYLRGKKGTAVDIGIKRGLAEDLLEFTIVRDKIPVHSIDVAMMLDEQTGYIKINRFSATTYDEFVQSLERLVEQEGMQDLVLDLRHNPGGYLQQATNMLSQLFADPNRLLVYTEGRSEKRKEYNSSGRPFYPIGDIVVLIDEGSASASEIVAGAIQDHDRGVIIGRRSFGKGLVQEQYPLRDGSALRLTVARYYTPSGRCIQKSYEDIDAYAHDMEERYENGEMADGEKADLADSTRYYTDNGYIVYGGGGIMPDIFVPLDTFLLQDEYLLWRQHMASFAFRYQEENPTAFEQMPMERFVQTYEVSTALLQEYLRYAREHGLTLSPPSSAQINKQLKHFLKARLARQYYGDEGFFQVLHSEDDMVAEAVRVLSQDDPLAAARGEE
jgi:carboxyl-terminal processing protease